LCAVLGRSFNLIDNETGWKIDVFILTNDAFKQSEFQRRQGVVVNDRGDRLVLPTPEDIIIQKLPWYRMTRHQSDKEWRDILGVVKLQGLGLDFAYPCRWAAELDLADDFQQICTEAGLAN